MTSLYKVYLFLKTPKMTIGWVHGVISIIGAFLLAYTTGMSLSILFQGDAAMRLLPAMLLTPLMACIFGFWLLFSQTRMQSILKISVVLVFNICIICFV